MSAIWGYVDLNSTSGSKIENCLDVMGKEYSKCAIDRLDAKAWENGFFACGLQCFSERAQKEQLPIEDFVNGYIFTADILLNARTKLAEELSRNESALAY